MREIKNNKIIDKKDKYLKNPTKWNIYQIVGHANEHDIGIKKADIKYLLVNSYKKRLKPVKRKRHEEYFERLFSIGDDLDNAVFIHSLKNTSCTERNFDYHFYDMIEKNLISPRVDKKKGYPLIIIPDAEMIEYKRKKIHELIDRANKKEFERIYKCILKK